MDIFLEFSSAQGRFNAVANTSGSATSRCRRMVVIYQLPHTKLDFVGAGGVTVQEQVLLKLLLLVVLH